jgi:hypothetical protein
MEWISLRDTLQSLMKPHHQDHSLKRVMSPRVDKVCPSRAMCVLSMLGDSMEIYTRNHERSNTSLHRILNILAFELYNLALPEAGPKLASNRAGCTGADCADIVTGICSSRTDSSNASRWCGTGAGGEISRWKPRWRCQPKPTRSQKYRKTTRQHGFKSSTTADSDASKTQQPTVSAPLTANRTGRAYLVRLLPAAAFESSPSVGFECLITTSLSSALKSLPSKGATRVLNLNPKYRPTEVREKQGNPLKTRLFPKSAETNSERGRGETVQADTKVQQKHSLRYPAVSSETLHHQLLDSGAGRLSGGCVREPRPQELMHEPPLYMLEPSISGEMSDW